MIFDNLYIQREIKNKENSKGIMTRNYYANMWSSEVIISIYLLHSFQPKKLSLNKIFNFFIIFNYLIQFEIINNFFF